MPSMRLPCRLYRQLLPPVRARPAVNVGAQNPPRSMICHIRPSSLSRSHIIPRRARAGCSPAGSSQKVDLCHLPQDETCLRRLLPAPVLCGKAVLAEWQWLGEARRMRENLTQCGEHGQSSSTSVKGEPKRSLSRNADR